MAQWKRNESWVGGAIVTKLFAIAAVMIALRVVAAAVHAPIEYRWPRGNLDRAGIVRQLESTPGEHLVIVQYGATHDLDAEWVYNAADLVHARVVWARDLDGENGDLANAFPERQFWSVQADEANPQPVRIARP